MADTTTEGTETAAPEASADTPPETPEVDWKAKAREWEKRAKANAKAAEQLASIEEAQKTEQQKLNERLEEAERLSAERATNLLRLSVAVAKGVPADLVDRLRGDSEEELSADADALLARLNAAPSPKPDPSQGAKPGDVALNGDPLLRDLKSKLGIS